ncbi:MAG: hypothetical protein P4L50_03380 [Anaerolineaceae bacterium]|nr:hypothetical protein [Anaerolineaceae bacterium]
MGTRSITEVGESEDLPGSSLATSPGKNLKKSTRPGSAVTDPAVLARIMQQAVKYWQNAGNPVQIANTKSGLCILLPSLHLDDAGNFEMSKLYKKKD